MYKTVDVFCVQNYLKVTRDIAMAPIKEYIYIVSGFLLFSPYLYKVKEKNEKKMDN